MVPLEAIGWFFLGAGVMLLTACVAVGWRAYVVFLRRKKFRAFLEGVKSAAEAEISQHQQDVRKSSAGREVSEFTFRDKMGVLTTVKIVIDHDLTKEALSEVDRNNLKSMLLSGEAGTLDQLLDGHSVQEEAMSKVQEFVFSPEAVRDMRSAGLEPDEVVTKMLKASGRM